MSDTKVHIVTNESEEGALEHAIDELGAVPKHDLREFIEDMRTNANAREETETQDKLAAVEEYWAGKLEELINE